GQIVLHDLVGARALRAAGFWILAILVDHARNRLRVQIALRREVTIKTSAREASLGHDVINRHGVEAVAVEQPASTLKDEIAGSVVMLTRRRHSRFLPCRACSGPLHLGGPCAMSA